MSYNIHLFNKQASKEDQISLRGLAIGNGLTGEQPPGKQALSLFAYQHHPSSQAGCFADFTDTCGADPAIQYGAYSDFALKNGVIGQILHDTMKKVGGTFRLVTAVIIVCFETR